MMRDLIFRPFALTNHNQTSFVKENDQIKRKLSYLLSKYIVWCKKKSYEYCKYYKDRGVLLVLISKYLNGVHLPNNMIFFIQII